jgi:hydroxyacylglutathione hydrolase
MKVTESVHALEIPFKVPVTPERQIDRLVFAYLIFGKKITLIDSGVAGAESIIFDYIRKNERDPHEISTLILSHSHPDHIGSARHIKEKTDCLVLCHPAEKGWIEDVERQAQERPVPGFAGLVGGSIQVDGLLQDGDLLEVEEVIQCKVLHTPGHSAGSISLFFEDEKVLFSGDALPVPGDLPVYDDIAACVASINKMRELRNIEILLSSWEAPIRGKDQIKQRMESSISYLQKIHNIVLSTYEENQQTGMELCKQVIGSLGLPPFVANSLLVKAFASSLLTGKDAQLFEF